MRAGIFILLLIVGMMTSFAVSAADDFNGNPGQAVRSSRRPQRNHRRRRRSP